MAIQIQQVNQPRQQITDPNELLRREALAKALQERSSGQRQIQHPMQGFAQLGDALVGGLIGQRADQERAANSEFMSEILVGANSDIPLSPEQEHQLFALNPQLGLQLRDRRNAREASAAEAARETEQEAYDRDRPIQFAGRLLDPVTFEVIQDFNPPEDSDVDQWGFPTSSTQSRQMHAFTLQGIDEQIALGIVSGRYDVRTNPQTGETSIVDLTTQSIAPLSGQQPDVPAPVGGQLPEQSASGSTLWDISDQATGVGSGLANATANTLGQLPGSIGQSFSFPAEVMAKQEFELFNRELILSLSLNPRYPISEQQRIAGLIPTGVGTAPQTLKLALVALSGELSRIEAEMIRSLENPSTPVDQRQKDMQTLRGVQVAIQRIGLPGNGRGGDPTGLRSKYGLE